MATGRLGRSTQEGVARTALAMMKMADNKIESVVRRRTSSFDVSQESVDDHGHCYVVDPVGKA